MDEQIEKKLIDISKMPQWLFLKEFIEQELDVTCDYNNANSFEEFVGYRTARTVFKEIVRKIDGAKDSATFR